MTTAEARLGAANARILKTASHEVPVAQVRWADTFARRLTGTDVASVIVAVSVAQLVRFGAGQAVVGTWTSNVSYTMVSVLLIVGWLVSLSLFHTRDRRVVGTGAEEYRRVGQASFVLFGTVAILAFVLGLDVARGYLAVALPLGLVSLTATRWLWRKWLMRRRADGGFISTVLVVGSHRAATTMAKTFERDGAAG
ncbi:MAG: sugar transferase, partial [Mycobacteriaceae bacterium]